MLIGGVIAIHEVRTLVEEGSGLCVAAALRQRRRAEATLPLPNPISQQVAQPYAFSLVL